MSDTQKPFILPVPDTQYDGQGVFTMPASKIFLAVTPQHHKKWIIEPTFAVPEGTTIKNKTKAPKAQYMDEGTDYNHIIAGFEGHELNHEPGFQAAVINYSLNDNFQWFGNGIDVIKVTGKDGLPKEPKDYEFYINVLNPKTIELTIEVKRKVAIDDKIHFRFKAYDPCSNNLINKNNDESENEFRTEILVSEDPVIIPTKPIEN